MYLSSVVEQNGFNNYLTVHANIGFAPTKYSANCRTHEYSCTSLQTSINDSDSKFKPASFFYQLNLELLI